MRSVVISFVVAALAANGSIAAADTIAGFAEVGFGTTGIYGPAGREFSGTSVKTQFGAGLRIDDLALSLNFAMSPIGSNNFERHSPSLFGMWLGPDARYFLSGHRGLQPYVRAGYQRMWVSGSLDVRRYCAESVTCTAGFWTEPPEYSGTATRVGLGVQWSYLRKGLYLGAWLDVGYDAVRMRVVEQDITGGIISVTLGGTFGGGRTRR